MIIDFEADLIRIARRELTAWGVPTLLLPDEDLLTRFFVLQHRALDPGPYTLHVSTQAMRSYILATPHVQAGAAGLFRRAFRKDVMWPHQSRRLLARARLQGRSKPSDAQHDGLFNDWGIQHLHLGLKITATDGFIDRSDTLAFAMARGTDLYVIDFRKHPKANWSDIELLEIVEQHWPHLLPALNVISASSPISTSHQEARNAGLSLVVTLSTGRVIAPSGGGFSTSGHAVKAIMKMDRVAYGLRAMQATLAENEAALLTQLGVSPSESALLEVHLELVPHRGLEVVANGRFFRLKGSRRFPEQFGL